MPGITRAHTKRVSLWPNAERGTWPSRIQSRPPGLSTRRYSRKVAPRSETWRSAMPIVTKSKRSLSNGSASPTPRMRGPRKTCARLASMPMLGIDAEHAPLRPDDARRAARHGRRSDRDVEHLHAAPQAGAPQREPPVEQPAVQEQRLDRVVVLRGLIEEIDDVAIALVSSS